MESPARLPAVAVDDLVKDYGSLRAVDHVTFAVAPGEVYGLLGPNGAGKTTTIRTLLGYLRPTAGRASALGGAARDTAIRRRIGYLPGDAAFDRRLRGHDVLLGAARLRGSPESRITGLAQRLDLDLDRRVGDLSKGNRQKIGVVQAFMHDPELLVLDEPTTGLDPLMQREVLALVREARDRGSAVLYCSHVLPEVEDVADRVGILRGGRLVHETTIDQVHESLQQHLEFRFPEPVDSSLVAGVPGVTSVEADGSRLIVSVTGSVAPLLATVAGAGVLRVVPRQQGLEDVFFEHYEDRP
jgi:ABC-2 type transport system ATP-binding protein